MAASPRHVAVLDVGKTNAKLVLFDLQEGCEVEARTMPNDVRADGPYPHFDVDRIFEFALDGLAEFARRAPIDALSITTHGASAALLAGEGLALPVLDYEHDEPDALAESYDRARPDFAESCSPRLPRGLNLGAQLFWQARTFPDRFALADRIVTYPQYWTWRFSGIAACEVTSLGCHTDLWNPKHRRFSSMVERLGWQRIMAPMRSAFDALGPMRGDLARRIGLKGEVPVHCGIHDSNASLLPHLLTTEPPFTVVSTGTWVIVMGVGGALDGLDPVRDTLANVDAFGRPVPSARFMGGREFDLLTGGAKTSPSSTDLQHVLDRQVMILPSIVPTSGPFPQARGGWANDERPRNAGEGFAAATLYLALMTDTCMGLAGAAGPIAVEGPMARNELYCQLLATLSNRPVHTMTGSTGTSPGAALLARGMPRSGAAGAPARQAISPLTKHGNLQSYVGTWKRPAGHAAGQAVSA